MRNATRTIKFTISEPMYNYIRNMSRENGVEMSEMMRLILYFFRTLYVIGEGKESQEFNVKLPNNRKEMKNELKVP